jgi:uncharacterized protein YoxC
MNCYISSLLAQKPLSLLLFVIFALMSHALFCTNIIDHNETIQKVEPMGLINTCFESGHNNINLGIKKISEQLQKTSEQMPSLIKIAGAPAIEFTIKPFFNPHNMFGEYVFGAGALLTYILKYQYHGYYQIFLALFIVKYLYSQHITDQEHDEDYNKIVTDIDNIVNTINSLIKTTKNIANDIQEIKNTAETVKHNLQDLKNRENYLAESWHEYEQGDIELNQMLQQRINNPQQ